MEVVQRISGGIRGRIKTLLGGERRVSNAQGPPLVSVGAGALVAECHRHWPQDEPFYEAWERLTERSGMGTTFTSSLWQRAVSEREPGDGLRLIAVRRGKELAAVLPMRLCGEGFLDMAGFAISDYLDPLVEDGAEEEVWRAILALLRQIWDGHVKAMTLHNLRQESPCRRWLHSLAAGEGFRCEEKAAGCCMKIRLPGSWEDYLAMLDGHERKEVRRKLAKAEMAGAALRVVDTAERAGEHLPAALDLMEAGETEKALWLREHVRPILTKIGVDLVRRGRMRLLTLMLDGAAGACLLELPSRRGPLMYNCGMAPSMRQWSPGAVLFAMAIRDAIGRGCEVFDLLRGEDEYKARLGAVREEMWRVSIFR